MGDLLEKIRDDENSKIARHLFEIEAIAKQKKIGSDVDKAIGELILYGIGQFNLEDGFEGIEAIGYEKPEIVYMPQNIERTSEIIHKENKDIVRHLVGIRNIVNTKCKRCNLKNCMGCYFSGRENFNIESGMRIIFLYDWKAILEVVQLKENSYWDDVYDFVNSLANKVGGGKIIELKSPDFETNYL